jgi:thiosulfate sulfurtransferase
MQQPHLFSLATEINPMAFQQLSVDDLKVLMATDTPLTVFDTRDPASYAAGHIDQAQALNNDTVQDLLAATPTSNAVVVCCYHGISSQSVAGWLEEQGYENVYSLTGGYSAWSGNS